MKKTSHLLLTITILLTTTCTKQDNDIAMKTPEEILTLQIEKNKAPGLQYYFFNKDSVICNFEGGYADIFNNKEVTEKSIFAGFSTTKTFTALAILQLAEKGMLELDDPVADYLKDFPYSANITIKQLLSHSAGIPNPMPLNWIHSKEEHDTFDRDAFFNKIFQKHNKIKKDPNEKFAYSNPGYFLLGQVIEKISGLSYEEYIFQNILNPLNLGDSDMAFVVSESGVIAKGYQKKVSFMNLMLEFAFDKSKYVDKTEGKWISFKEMFMNGPSYGGLKGTGMAYVKYLQELLKSDNCLISEEYKQMLFTENILNNGKPSGMCLSWFKSELNGHTYFAHAGGGVGFYCEIRIYPDIDMGSVIMFNRSGMKNESFLDKLDKYLIIK